MLLKRTVLAVSQAIFGVRRGIRGFVVQTRLLLIVLIASLLLVGCVDYDLDVSFDSPNQGAIVQSIKLGEQFTTLSPKTAQEWLNSLEVRAKQLQGKSQRISDTELTVTIPFYYGAELEQKFNQFFNATEKGKKQPAVTANTDLPEIKSNLSLKQNNLLLLLRNRLSYDLDLRSLSRIASDGSVIVDPGSLLDLEFHLNTPWGARSIAKGEKAIKPESQNQGHQLIWHLQPGKINHLEAIFWLPNPLGIGAVIIALFVAAGIYLKYNRGLGVAKKPTRAAA
ncbi:DUF3153 domain-containing protein [Microseira sp. BLCC-F43]|uniref:DUF3153 domain-containing protein n=1 Tax=Microseira sp. BLCC-F43 TaxID=3153602 RepID=UPI0035B6F0B8